MGGVSMINADQRADLREEFISRVRPDAREHVTVPEMAF